jgi:hypothetical protein
VITSDKNYLLTSRAIHKNNLHQRKVGVKLAMKTLIDIWGSDSFRGKRMDTDARRRQPPMHPATELCETKEGSRRIHPRSSAHIRVHPWSQNTWLMSERVERGNKRKYV